MKIFIKSILIYLLFFAAAVGFRAVFLVLHADEGYSAAQAVRALVSGLRFDMQFIGYAAAVYYIFALVRWRPWRLLVRVFFALCAVVFTAANCIFYVFFNIYGKNFDNQLFLFRNEKFSELAAAAWAENYGIIPAFIAFLICSYLLIYAICKIDGMWGESANATRAANPADTRRVVKSLAAFVVFALAMMLSINQQLHYKATSVYNTLRFGPYAAINASMPGHLKGFLAALRDGLIIRQHTYEDFAALPPREAACKMLALSPCPERFDIADVARNSNPVTPLEHRPEKVFYVISESLSDWISDPRFAPLWGEFFRPEMAYLPSIENAPSTTRSLQAQFMGVYYNDTDNLHFYKDLAPLPTNLITRARKAGYEVHFYFGGANNWAELFDLLRELDPAVVLHDKDDAIEWAREQGWHEPLANNWGAFDDVLFAYARANAAPNTFNIFMTITNHPAYDLAWLPRSPAEPSWEAIDAISPKYRKELATVQWYLRVLGRWLDGARAGELYFVTGDHYGRYNVDDSPDAWLTHSVPVFAYAPGERIVPAASHCSHLGIAASIFALLGKADDVTLAPACFSAHRGGETERSGVRRAKRSQNSRENAAESGNKTAVQNRELNFYGFEYSLIGGKLAPTPPEAAALGWYLGYKGQHFE